MAPNVSTVGTSFDVCNFDLHALPQTANLQRSTGVMVLDPRLTGKERISATHRFAAGGFNALQHALDSVKKHDLRTPGASEMRHLGFGVVLDAGDSYRQTVLIGLEGALSRYI